jgi:hypothetical protein
MVAQSYAKHHVRLLKGEPWYILGNEMKYHILIEKGDIQILVSLLLRQAN